VAQCRNGLAVNYTEPYMRRRDPECSVIGDARFTDKLPTSCRIRTGSASRSSGSGRRRFSG